MIGDLFILSLRCVVIQTYDSPNQFYVKNNQTSVAFEACTIATDNNNSTSFAKQGKILQIQENTIA